MPKISELRPPTFPLSGLELLVALQGGGSDDANVGLPSLAVSGLPTGAVLCLRSSMNMDLSSTSDSDPGPGNLRLNNATPSSTTYLYVDDVDVDASDLSALWSEADPGGYIYLQACETSERRDVWAKWQFSSVVDATGYAKFNVSFQAGEGAFVDGEPVELTIQQPSPSPGVNRNIVTALSIIGGVVTVDCSLGDYFTLALTANVTGWAFINVPPGCTPMIEITQDSTPRTVAWPSSFKWAGGTAGVVSTASGAEDMLALTTFNIGSTWRVTLGKDFK